MFIKSYNLTEKWLFDKISIFLQKFRNNFEIRRSCKQGNYTIVSHNLAEFRDSPIWTNHYKSKLLF